MERYQREFIEFAIAAGALRFGRFTLKSGRVSPYFFNTGAFDSGSSLSRLASAYASTIVAHDLRFDLLFGPAYKGIPLGAATAVALHLEHGRDVAFCFNRKEAKDHGEGGACFGAPLAGRVLIIDDVISAGTSVTESMRIISSAGADAVGVLISLDRQERGSGPLSAASEIRQAHRIPVHSIVGLSDVLEYLRGLGGQQERIAAIEAYLEAYGACVQA